MRSLQRVTGAVGGSSLVLAAVVLAVLGVNALTVFGRDETAERSVSATSPSGVVRVAAGELQDDRWVVPMLQRLPFTDSSRTVQAVGLDGDPVVVQGAGPVTVRRADGATGPLTVRLVVTDRLEGVVAVAVTVLVAGGAMLVVGVALVVVALRGTGGAAP